MAHVVCTVLLLDAALSCYPALPLEVALVLVGLPVLVVLLTLLVLVLVKMELLGLMSLKLPTPKLGPVLDLKLMLVLLRPPCGLGLMVLRNICLVPGPPRLGPTPLLSTSCVLLVAAKSL